MVRVKYIFEKMKSYFCVVCILLCVWSCHQHDPSMEILSYNFVSIGNGQVGFAGEYFQDDLWVFYDYSQLSFPSDDVEVHFEVTSGGGSVDSPRQTLVDSVFVKTRWKAGFDSPDQSVTAHVYGKNRKLLASMTFSAKVSFNFAKSGDGQIGVAGEYLENVLSVVYNTDREIQVKFEVTSGGGSVDSPSQTLSPQTSVVSTKWKTGTHSTNQSVTARLYTHNGTHLTDLTYSSVAFQTGKWDTVYNSPDRFLTMAKDVVNKKTYIIKNDNRLYVQGDHYYSKWNIVESFQDKECQSAKVDSKGMLYVVTNYGELYKSADQGTSFVLCNRPYSKSNIPFRLHITNNDYIWVNNNDDPWRYSSDEGQTWVSTDYTNFIDFADIYNLSDGSFITVDWMDNQYSYYRSINGINWLPIPGNFPKSPLGMFVSDKDEIIVYGQETISIIIYKSTDFLSPFSSVYSVTKGEVSGVVFEKHNDVYYICFPGSGIYKTKDFTTFEVALKNASISNFMIDHNGVLFAVGNNNTMHYWKDKD